MTRTCPVMLNVSGEVNNSFMFTWIVTGMLGVLDGSRPSDEARLRPRDSPSVVSRTEDKPVSEPPGVEGAFSNEKSCTLSAGSGVLSSDDVDEVEEVELYRDRSPREGPAIGVLSSRTVSCGISNEG